MWSDQPDHSLALGRNRYCHVAVVALRMSWLQRLKEVVRQENVEQWPLIQEGSEWCQ